METNDNTTSQPQSRNAKPELRDRGDADKLTRGGGYMILEFGSEYMSPPAPPQPRK